MDLVRKFEIHYYLVDKSHSMDAFIKNKCEAEFLAVAAEVADILGIQIIWESEALEEGGIKEIWAALGANNAQIALIVSVLALIWSVVPQTDQELVDLQKEETRLSIEEKKLAIEKLKAELKKEKPANESIETAAKIANNSYKVVTRRSNFYKSLSAYDKVYQVGFSGLDTENHATEEERIVRSVYFSRFILTSNELEPVRIDHARIDIVAPVLTEGKAKWKGIYENEYITFSMDDSDFRKSVLSKQISFKNGSAIFCVLLIYKKLDELGDIVNSGYSVDVVLDTIDSGSSMETPQGRQYRHTRKLLESQKDLFGTEK